MRFAILQGRLCVLPRCLIWGRACPEEPQATNGMKEGMQEER